MKIVLDYLKEHKKAIVVFFIFTIIFTITFYLYNLPLESVLYAFLLSLVVGSLLIIIDIISYRKKHLELEDFKNKIDFSIDNLPESKGIIEEDYKELIEILFKEKGNLEWRGQNDLKEMVDYYTLWAHEIKTPISAMKLLLQSEDIKEKRSLLNELFKIEQYVEMVLGYLRIGSMSSDLLIKSYSLDNIIKQVVRKYAGLFIGKKIKLDFNTLDIEVLTDEKWLVFVIEQIISNSIKYTKEGGTISIYMDKNSEKTLVIQDNGIGIKKEDLPRVFEKGFTGLNGRNDKKSTGIGLYLCKNILNKLSHTIEIESQVGEFTRIKIGLDTLDLS